LALQAAGIPFEIIPGIASPVAATAYSGIPLTHRELSSSVTFITGSDREGKEWSPEQWKKLATATDTICVLMGMRRIEEITQAIIDGGRSPETSAAVIQWGARPEQRVVTGTLANIAHVVREQHLSNPAVIVIGEVVTLRSDLRWYDNRPLFGKRILVPRPREQGKTTAKAIRERGAEPTLLPSIEICAPSDRAPLERAITELGTYDWVLFTSANGVERWFAELEAKQLDARAFGTAKVAVIGPKTALALTRGGIRADLVAEEFVGEGLAEALLKQGTPKRVLLARALVARDALPESLRSKGVQVDVVAVYETKAAQFRPGESLVDLIEQQKLDAVLFTSSSTVTSVVDALGPRARELLSGLVVASIGPITSRTLTEHGVNATVSAAVYTVDGLLDALETHYSG
jgi:uroporphyrinogen III methyltransferase/synthase